MEILAQAQAALAIAPWVWKALTAAGFITGGYSIGKGIWETLLNAKLSGKQLSLQDKMLTGQLKASTMANEQNTKQANDYMAMLTADKAEQRKDKAKDRELAMLMTMIQGMNQMGQAGINANIESRRTAPPMALTTLLRGQ
jgi:hypothetical protein